MEPRSYCTIPAIRTQPGHLVDDHDTFSVRTSAILCVGMETRDEYDEGHSRQRDYVSYLLRIWQDSGDEELPVSKVPPWRASLQSPHTGKRIGFADLESLFAYLRAQTVGESTARED